MSFKDRDGGYDVFLEPDNINLTDSILGISVI